MITSALDGPYFFKKFFDSILFALLSEDLLARFLLCFALTLNVSVFTEFDHGGIFE